ncbi:hypothetical protein Clacol_007042 [Clathrus columnatus]|uniref:Uncharacterized protein n=1 Tax=Clathrus columnatus TaxID=1419009 RepID=A0AAV5ADU4_9AGAM|nr:hypothetical protein Clacol_007042 [Clathrus columnatus]
MLSFGNTTATIFVVGPDELGGRGDVSTKAESLAKETGRDIHEIIIELFMPNKGETTDLIGLPKVYDYECHNMKATPFMISVLTGMYPKMFKLFHNCDGVVATSNRLFEPESNDTFKSYYERSGRSYYVVGPLALTSTDQLSRERSSDRDAVKRFLGRMLQKRGERSVIYVSFGSTYWPLNVEASWKVIKIICEKQIPMIFVHNDEYGRPPMPNSLRAELETSRSVLITTWAPQNMVLGHKATAWFLTHCGLNSISESLSHGIPMIGWPADVDQPINAMYIGDLKHNVGYELLEVLQRDESKPLYRGYTPSGTLEAIEKEFTTVLQNAFGRDGAEKRHNAERFKEELSGLWDEDGDAQMELRRFIKDYLS